MNSDQMSCGEVLEKLPLYVGEDLDPQVLDAVRVHLERCAVCSRRVESAARARRSLIAAFLARESESVPAGLWPGIRNTLRAEGRIRAPGDGARAQGERPVPPQLDATRPQDGARDRAPRPWRARILVPLAAAAGLLAVVQLSGLIRTDPTGKIRPRDLPQERVGGGNHGGESVVVVPVSDTGAVPPTPGTLRRVAPGESGLRSPYRRSRGSGEMPAEGDVSLAGFK